MVRPRRRRGHVGRSQGERFDSAYRVVKVLTGPLIRFEPEPVPAATEAALAGPAVIASNHRSMFDAIAAVRVLGAMGCNARPLSAAWLWDVVGLGPVLDRLAAIPLGHGRAAMTAIDTAVAHVSGGGRVLVTPEGRIVAPEDRARGVGEGHKILSRIACAAEVPVVPAALVGTDVLWPLGRRLPVVRPWRRPIVRSSFGLPRRYDSLDHRGNVDASMADISALIDMLSGTTGALH